MLKLAWEGSLIMGPPCLGSLVANGQTLFDHKNKFCYFWVKRMKEIICVLCDSSYKKGL